MRVYELTADLDRYSVLVPRSAKDDALYRLFDGRPLGHEWTPIAVAVGDADDTTGQVGDFSLLGTIPVFSAHAARTLSTTLRKAGELLPLLLGEQQFFAYNVTHVIDALDEAESVLERFAASGRVMSISRYSFHRERVAQVEIFKIPQLLKGYVFVTEPFVEMVVQANLSGFVFRVVSEDETGAATEI